MATSFDVPSGPAATIDSRIDTAMAALGESPEGLEAAMLRDAVINATYGLLAKVVYNWPRVEPIVHPGQEADPEAGIPAVEAGTVIIGAATASAHVEVDQDGQGHASLSVQVTTEAPPAG